MRNNHWQNKYRTHYWFSTPESPFQCEFPQIQCFGLKSSFFWVPLPRSGQFLCQNFNRIKYMRLFCYGLQYKCYASIKQKYVNIKPYPFNILVLYVVTCRLWRVNQRHGSAHSILFMYFMFIPNQFKFARKCKQYDAII